MPASGIRSTAFRISRCSNRRSHFWCSNKMVLAREGRRALKKDDRTADFVTDACATVGIAYHRAAGVYAMDKEMHQLGTAAVHLLTMATSYMRAQEE